MTNSFKVYKGLLQNPGNSNHMLVLADALDEEEHEELAAAYRWAADRGKWPFLMHRLYKSDQLLSRHSSARPPEAMYQEVWDWDYAREKPPLVYECSLLPKNLFDEVKHLHDRKYGWVNQAFVLLAHALAGLRRYQPRIMPWPEPAVYCDTRCRQFFGEIPECESAPIRPCAKRMPIGFLSTWPRPNG